MKDTTSIIQEGVNDNIVCPHCNKQTKWSKILGLVINEPIPCEYCGKTLIYPNNIIS